MLLSARHWQERLLLWTAVAAIGMVAVLFARPADLAQAALRHLLQVSLLIPLVLAPFGFAGIGWLSAQHDMVFPLMISVIIATSISRLLSPPLYRTLAERYL